MINFPRLLTHKVMCLITSITQIFFIIFTTTGASLQCLVNFGLISFLMILNILLSDIDTTNRPIALNWLIRTFFSLAVFNIGLLLINTVHPVYLTSALFCATTVLNTALVIIYVDRNEFNPSE